MPTKAAALKYDKDTAQAPTVVAKGKGNIAEIIIKKAKEFDVPIFANETLVNSLVDLEIDHEIPAELYKAVADTFIWLMKNEKKFAQKLS